MEVTPITVHYLFGANSYLLKTDAGYHLIDTGIAKKRGQLEKQLEEAGCRLGDLKLIIITHGHLDHMGNAAYLKDRCGAKVAMHRGDLKMVETGDMFADAGGGATIRLVGFLMKALGLSDYEKFTPDIYVEDGQDLSPFGLKAIVMHTPGHSNGSISVLTEEGDLFCGDLFNNSGKPVRASLVQDAGQLEASVQKVKALGDVKVYPGHGKPFRMMQLEE
jgi:glyoxylase-like metal-dependent hydrolase (beta-lactamase superfamily II)